jgi:adenylate cyclase
VVWLRKFFQYALGGAIGALIGLATGLILFFTPIGEKWHWMSYDFPFRVRDDIPVDDVMMVYMDEESHAHLGQPFIGGWDRAATHAKLLDRLKEDRAEAAVFDIVFSDTNRVDPIFAAAITNYGRVVLAADKRALGRGRTDASGNTVDFPNDMLIDAATPERIGIAELRPEVDNVVRRHTQLSKDDQLPTLSWAAAKVAQAPITKNELELRQLRWINYYGLPGFLPNVSYWRAITPGELPKGFFRNKVVFIGSRSFTKASADRKDEYPSPHSLVSKKEIFMPGVEIQATLFLNLLREDWLMRLHPRQEVGIIIALGVLFGIGLAQLRPVFSASLGIVSMLGVTAMGYIMATQTHFWFAWLIIVIQIFVCSAWSIIFNSINIYVQSRLLFQSLSMYVSPDQAKQISKNPTMLKPGAEKQELSILFSDIANFTAMSEGMDPDDLAKLMNTYFESAVGLCIYKTQGTVVKFIGDAIFAIWNAPTPQSDHHEKTCRGAILLRDQVTNFEFNKPGLEVRTRIGLHAGEASVGNFGSSTRVDYTAFGENINLASRMEGLNKYLGTSILATGAIINHVKDKFVSRFLGNFQLKGFEKAVEVYELISFPEQSEDSKWYRESFAEALALFKARKWDEADHAFHCIAEKRGADGPSKFYLKQIAELRAEELPASWDGSIELKEK